MNKLLTSSADPNKMAMTVKGVLIGLIPLILVIAGVAQIDLTAGELTEMVESVGSAIVAGWLAVSAVITAFGLVRKVILKFTNRG